VTPALLAYRAAGRAAEPLAPGFLRSRARAGKEDPARLHERLGRPTAPRPPGPLAWLHGASVGESLSLLPLAERLRAARPEVQLLVTSGTVTSAQLLARRLPPGALHQFTPLDTPGSAARFLDHWRPDLAVFAESELWPNLVTGARARGARLALLSARLSESSFRSWRRAPAAARAVLDAFDLVMAQDDETAARLARLGAADHGRLNLKLVGDPLPVDETALAAARAAARGRPVLLAASTHPGEEAIALDAFARLPDALLVLAPRHPARGPEVDALARRTAPGVTLASRGEPFGAAPVHVADTLGELGLWLRLARAALLGGSLTPGVGGHNPLEPARLGAAFTAGPHLDNWRGVYADLRAADAFAPVTDAAELAAFWTDPPRGRAERARAWAAAHAGQLDAALPRLLQLLP